MTETTPLDTTTAPLNAKPEGDGRTLTGGEALALALAQEGVTHVFGVPGIQLDWAVDGLRQVQDRIRFMVPRHEQGTTYMADGYARSTGEVGVAMVVPGPGVLNAMSGLATAYACNSRVLMLAGDIFSQGLGLGHGLLHEVRDQTAILGKVTKWQGRAGSPQEIPGLVREAMRQLHSGRPQPVALEIAHDVLSSRAHMAAIEPSPLPDGRLHPDPAEITQAAKVLADARFPLIYAGGGVLAARAADELARVADKLQAPVVMSDHGRGSLPDRHPLALNTLGGRAVFPHADVVLVVGSRFLEFNQGTPVWPEDGKRYVFLNIEPRDWEPPRTRHATVHADAGLGLAALADELDGGRPSRAPDMERVRAWATDQTDRLEAFSAWPKAMRRVIPCDGIVLIDLTMVGYFTRLTYPLWEPYTMITPGYQGTLGYGFPAGLGVAAGNPGRAVVAVTGDGGFGWTLQELSTARKYDLGLVTLVFNDDCFGNVRVLQRSLFGEAYGADLLNPDYGKLADAYRIPFSRVTTPAELEGALGRALADGGPALIEVKIGELPNPWHLFRLRAPFGRGGEHGAPPNPLGEPPTKEGRS